MIRIALRALIFSLITLIGAGVLVGSLLNLQVPGWIVFMLAFSSCSRCSSCSLTADHSRSEEVEGAQAMSGTADTTAMAEVPTAATEVLIAVPTAVGSGVTAAEEVAAMVEAAVGEETNSGIHNVSRTG